MIYVRVPDKSRCSGSGSCQASHLIPNCDQKSQAYKNTQISASCSLAHKKQKSYVLISSKILLIWTWWGICYSNLNLVHVSFLYTFEKRWDRCEYKWEQVTLTSDINQSSDMPSKSCRWVMLRLPRNSCRIITVNLRRFLVLVFLPLFRLIILSVSKIQLSLP